MAPPRLTVSSVTIGAPDPRALGAFYARMLSTAVTASEPPETGEPAEAGWAQLRAPDGPTLNFEYEREYQAPVWPSAPGRQQTMEHLDIWVDDLEAATRWAVECGARLAEVQPQQEVRVLFDPAGHPFCLFT